MNIGIDVDITIKTDSDYINIPVIPPEISYDDGSSSPVSVSVIKLGSVDFSNGTSLGELSWSCFFPARFDPGYCRGGDMLSPAEYRDKLSELKNSGKPIQVIIPAADINMTMLISSFKWTFKGFEGDMYYDVSFKEHREIVPVMVSNAEYKPETPRPPEPVKTEIKKGDKVKFKGGPVYVTANDANPAARRREAICSCTLTYSGKHPYHLVYSSGDMVYGWVDAADCEKL